MTITYKQKFNKLYGYPKDTEHSLSEIATLSGYKLKGIQTIFSKSIRTYACIEQPTSD